MSDLARGVEIKRGEWEQNYFVPTERRHGREAAAAVEGAAAAERGKCSAALSQVLHLKTDRRFRCISANLIALCLCSSGQLCPVCCLPGSRASAALYLPRSDKKFSDSTHFLRNNYLVKYTTQQVL